jgi:arginine decarboxylase
VAGRFNMNLYEQLKNYGDLDYYPFHMPGHKRNKEISFVNPFHFDITEIDGFDNLHHSEGIILEAQKRASILYGAEESHFLINGTTAGLLSAISACTSKGGTILMARNCHKAVYNGVFLNELKSIYIYPQNTGKYCVNGGLNPQNIKPLLINNKNIQAVIITSPTYDGVVSDIKGIAKEVHKYNIPLIVDEAHGAHFGFHSYFPSNSISKGADVVIHSVHKTLPSLTQTALIHVNGTIVDRDKVRKYLSIYQTSSPSYVLMASIDSCIKLLSERGNDLFQRYVNELSSLRNQLNRLNKIKLIDESMIGTSDIYNLDRSKLIISVKNTDISGKELYNRLLTRYHLQMEMVAGDYVLGMTSIMDTKDGYKRLLDALLEIDNEINYVEYEDEITLNIKAKVCYTITKAQEKESIECELEEAEGKISAEYVYLYPPGIPLIAPGEIITKNLINMIIKYKKMNLNIEGMKDFTCKKILIINEVF